MHDIDNYGFVIAVTFSIIHKCCVSVFLKYSIQLPTLPLRH